MPPCKCVKLIRIPGNASTFEAFAGQWELYENIQFDNAFLMHVLFAIRCTTGRRPQNTMAEEAGNYALWLFGSCTVWLIGMNVISCVLPSATWGMLKHY